MTDSSPLGLKDAARVVYAGITRQALEEASQLDSVDGEIALLRVWLAQSIEEHPRDPDLMRALFTQIVRAVAIKYRLSPKRTNDFASALAAVLDGIGGQFDVVRTEV